MAEKVYEVRPLTSASPSSIYRYPTSDEEAAAGPPQYLHKRRAAVWCCGCCGATVVILGVLALVLALTAFKVKDPVLTVNTIRFDNVDAALRSFADPTDVSVNVTLTADISIKNPNVASFRFDNSTTEFYYGAETLGVAYAPSGRVKAHRTLRMNVTVEVLADRVAEQDNVTRTLAAGGEVDITSFTEFTGRVTLFGVYRRDVEARVNCSMTLVASQQGVKNKVCQASVN